MPRRRVHAQQMRVVAAGVDDPVRRVHLDADGDAEGLVEGRRERRGPGLDVDGVEAIGDRIDGVDELVVVGPRRPGRPEIEAQPLLP